MAGDSALKELRKDPEKTIAKEDFFVDCLGFKPTVDKSNAKIELGGPVTLKATAEAGITRISLAPKGTDYFFPWVNRGVGEVEVPVGAPDGTIVVTGGMNGCSLHVTRDDKVLRFYHDADSKYLADFKRAKGDKLCRVEPSLYMKIPAGKTIVEENPKEGLAFLYQMLCVRHAKRWKVVYSGIIIGPGIKMPLKRSFTPGVSKLLTSFAED